MAICIGCGLEVVDGILVPKLDPAGHITCSDAGLAVPGGVTVPGVSPDSCNGFELRGNGYYAPCPDSIVGTTLVQVSPQGSGLPQAVGDGGSFSYLNDNSPTNIHICNTTCCTVSGLVFVKVGDVYFQASPTFVGSAHLEVNINNAGFGSIEPTAITTFTNNGTGDSYAAVDLDAHLFLSLAAGACVDYQWAVVFNIGESGADSHIRTNSVGPKFVTRWQLTQTGCC